MTPTAAELACHKSSELAPLPATSYDHCGASNNGVPSFSLARRHWLGRGDRNRAATARLQVGVAMGLRNSRLGLRSEEPLQALPTGSPRKAGAISR